MIELVPKVKTERITISPYRIAFCVLIGAALALTFSLFVVEVQKRSVEKKLEETRASLAEENMSEIRQLEEEVLGAKKEIEIYQGFLASHRYSSLFFDFISGLTHKKVFFKKIDLNVYESRVLLTGETNNFSELRKQILILKNEKNIKKVNLVNVSLNDFGGIDFVIDLVLDPSVFNDNFQKEKI